MKKETLLPTGLRTWCEWVEFGGFSVAGTAETEGLSWDPKAWGRMELVLS